MPVGTEEEVFGGGEGAGVGEAETELDDDDEDCEEERGPDPVLAIAGDRANLAPLPAKGQEVTTSTACLDPLPRTLAVLAKGENFRQW